MKSPIFSALLLWLMGLSLSGATLAAGNEPHQNASQPAASDSGHTQDRDIHAEESDGHHDEGEHDDHGEADEHSATEVTLSAEQIAAAGIVVTPLAPQALPNSVAVPGEVQFDRYRSAEVAPLVEAIVIKRLARLGDHVDAGQPLVRLASVAVAQAQGELDVAAREWRRVKKLGQQAVGAKRYAEAEIAAAQARLKLQAYGLSAEAIEAIATGRNDTALGQFELTAPLAGTVLSDDFVRGQRVDPGQTLFLLTDESSIWVEAHVQPAAAVAIDRGMAARVRMPDGWHEGTVIQRHHLLDERTRTVPVRVEVALAEAHHHHRGEFVQVEIITGSAGTVLAVPEAALMRDAEGRWVVFVEDEPNTFAQVPVSRGAERAGLVEIHGLASGARVVTAGAFYVASELAKGGFSVHNH